MRASLPFEPYVMTTASHVLLSQDQSPPRSTLEEVPKLEMRPQWLSLFVTQGTDQYAARYYHFLVKYVCVQGMNFPVVQHYPDMGYSTFCRLSEGAKDPTLCAQGGSLDGNSAKSHVADGVLLLRAKLQAAVEERPLLG